MRGTLFGGPYDKDYTILGSILGSPYFGKLPCLTSLVTSRTATSGMLKCDSLCTHVSRSGEDTGTTSR